MLKFLLVLKKVVASKWLKEHREVFLGTLNVITPNTGTHILVYLYGLAVFTLTLLQTILT